MNKLLLLVLLCLATILCGAAAESPGDSQVLVLDLKLVKGTFYLRHFAIVSETLPTSVPLDPVPGRIHYTVMDHSARPLSDGVMNDPSRVQKETGKKTTVPVDTLQSDSVDVQLKLPYELEMHRIHFARIASSGDSAGIAMMRTEDMGAVYVELHGEPDGE